MAAVGFYRDMDKEVRDLFCKDFQHGISLNLAPRYSLGTILQNVNTHLRSANITTDFKADSNSMISATMEVEPAPGLRTVFDLIHPSGDSGKVELQYQNDFAGISSSFELSAEPVVNMSCMLGGEKLSIGADVLVDTVTGSLKDAKVGFRAFDPYICSLNVNVKDSIACYSVYQVLNPKTHTAVGHEFAYDFKKEMSRVTVGIQHALDSSTLVKACVDNFGKARASIQRELWPSSLIKITGEFNVRSMFENARVGLSLAFTPTLS